MCYINKLNDKYFQTPINHRCFTIWKTFIFLTTFPLNRYINCAYFFFFNLVAASNGHHKKVQKIYNLNRKAFICLQAL